MTRKQIIPSEGQVVDLVHLQDDDWKILDHPLGDTLIHMWLYKGEGFSMCYFATTGQHAKRAQFLIRVTTELEPGHYQGMVEAVRVGSTARGGLMRKARELCQIHKEG